MNRGMEVDTLRLVWKYNKKITEVKTPYLSMTVSTDIPYNTHLLRGEVDVVDDHVCDLQCLVLVRLRLLSALLEQIWRNAQIMTLFCFFNRVQCMWRVLSAGMFDLSSSGRESNSDTNRPSSSTLPAHSVLLQASL